MMSVLLWQGTVFAEGSWQVGLYQGLTHEQKLRDYVKSGNKPIYVDILNPNEVINIHVCGEANGDSIAIEVYDPSGAEITTGTGTGHIDRNDNFDHLLTTPRQYIAPSVGTYQIRLKNTTNSERPLGRFDITVTPTATNPDPRLKLGRVWTDYWSFVTKEGYAEDTSTDADFYAVAKGGFTDTYYVWKLDLNNLVGNSYKIVANTIGVKSPNPAGNNVSGLSVPQAPEGVNSVDPLYPIYLSYPAKSFPSPTTQPTIQNARFIDNANKDSSISPSATTGVQDKGNFIFDTNLTSSGGITGGIYAITIDTNKNGQYGAGDVLLMGSAVPGTNTVEWGGKDNDGNWVPVGNYTARLEVRTGEFHYVAEDVEVSGGNQDGLTIYKMTDSTTAVSVAVFWDDTKIGGGTTLPDGAMSDTSAGHHTWGILGENPPSSSIGDDSFIDTYAYGAKAVFLGITVIISDGSDDNLRPVAKDDSTGTPINTPVTIKVLQNDTDPDDTINPATIDLDPLTPGIQTTYTVTGKGTFDVISGEVKFTPVTGFTGSVVEINYTVSDTYTPSETSDPAKISVFVGKLPPVANNDSVSATVGTPITFSVLGNDSDPDGTLAANTTTNLSSPSGGTLANNGNGTFTYTPSSTGNFSFTYTVKDNDGLDSNLATVNINVSVPVPVNNPPTANPDSANTKAGTPVTLNIVSNDSDSDGTVIPSTVDLDPNTAGFQSSYTVSDQGTFTADASGNVTFTPLPTFAGTSTIPYTINDDDGAPSNQANISVTVAPNQPPVAANDSAETLSNTPVTLTVVSNDTDPDGSINNASVDLDPATPGIQNTYTKEGEGTFTVNASGIVTFTPANNFSGISTIPYTVNDNLGKTSNPANISITVVNRPPVANNDIAATTSGTSVTVNVVENDSDPDGTIDPATVDLDPNTPGIQQTFTIPDQGTFTTDPSGNVTFVFTPLPTFEGSASASYVVNDDKGATSNPASITITVTNSPPVAKDDSKTTPWNTPVKFSAVSNDTDPDNNLDVATVDLDPNKAGIQTTFTKPGEGTFTVNALGEVTFTPLPWFAGVSTIPYRVSDQVKAESNIANISVTVENAPPNAEDDSGATTMNTPVSIPVLSNDSDPNHDPLTVDSIVTQPGNGTVTFTADGTVIYTPNPGFFGTDTFVYQISDGHGGTDTATVTIKVDDSSPTAVSDSAVTLPDTPVAISVLSNDSDPDGDPLTVTGITKPNNGTVVLNADGTVTYTPNPGFIGTDTFTYTITDPDGNTDTAVVTVVIAPEIPYCIDDMATTPSNTPVTVPVLNNDTDPDGDLLTVTHITQPANGTAVLNADGTVTYTPNPGFRGVETFTYTACDNDGNCDIASVTITVKNAPPNAEDDSTATPPNTPVSIPVLTNDSDPNNDPLIIDTIVTQPVNGTVTFTEDGTVIYTPNPGFTGTDTFVYEISDGHGGTDTATVTILVDNDSPTAVSDSAVTPPDTPVSIEVLANDSDSDGDPLTVTDITDPANGTVVINSDGTVTYTPNPGFIGTDTFVYTITDPDGNADTAIVTVVINPKVPDAVDDTGRTPTNTPITVPILANDSDPNGDPLTVSHITQPANGIAILNPDGTVTYTPNPGFSGVETFTYTVCDHNGNCDMASVTITVENAPPNAEDDSTATPPNTPVSIPVLTNDSDPNGDMLTVERIVTQPLNGTVSITPEGTVIYTPNGNFTGTDTFVYEISDGKGGTDTATVTVKIDNDSPTAVADSAVTPPDTPIDIAVIANDSDPDNAPLTVTEVTTPSHGTVKNNSDGTVTYTPNPGFIGTDTFSYTIKNPDGNTDTAIVTVIVNPKTPNAVDNTAGTRTDTPVTVKILDNDSDPNSDPVTVSKITQPANGTAVLNPDGTVTYTPNTGFSGAETFTYTVCDDNGNCDIAAVTVTVENAPPVAEDDSASTPMNTRVSIPVLTNDSDPNNDPLTVDKIVTQPANGTVSFTPDGTMIYEPNPGFSGTDTFVYQISDGHGGTDTATVTVKVNDDSPTAVADSAVTPPDSPVSIRVLANDSDPDGDPLTLTDVTTPAHGTLIINPDGTVTYTPKPGFVGTDTFFYTVSDPDNNSDTAIVTVIVNPKSPDAVDDTRRTPTDTPVTIPVLATDSDPNSDPLTVSKITQPANGKAALNSDGTVTYTPNPGFSGTDTFTYTACDNNGNCDIASVTITVENAPPIAEDDSASTPVNTPVSVPVLTNDSDPNHDPIIVEKIVSKPANGKVSFTYDGTMIYTPNSGFVGADTFVYQISDGKGGTDTATVTIFVNNETPTAVSDSVVTQPDQPVDIDILSNDSGKELIVSNITTPAHGTVVLNDDGTVTYTPEPGFVGTDSFTYTVTDPDGNSNTAIVTAVVNPQIPFAVDDVGVTPYLTPITTPVLANDKDPDNAPLTVSHVTRPANGTTVLNDDGTVTYTPNIGFSGTDTYTYMICNPSDQCDIASVTVTVENAPPVAEDDSASTQPNTPVSVPILVNDSDPNNDPLVVDEITRPPTNGTVSFTPDGTLVYTPNPGFTGVDIFFYQISDGNGGTDTAMVTITVDDKSPTAVADSVVTRPDQPLNIAVLANDSDPNRDPLTVTHVTEPSHGTVGINGDGTVTYHPEPGFIGTDSFTYTATDPDGNSDTATVTVRVMPQTPEALDDTGKTPTDTPVTVDILANDRDPDGDILSVTAITQPANGKVILNEDGRVTYTPNNGFSGTDTFTYTVCDPGNHCDMAAVTISVENAPPVAIDDNTSTRPNQPVSIPVLVNDSDPNGDPLTIKDIVTKPKHGTVSFTPDGTVIYTPKPGFTGIDTFVYEISDGKGGTDTATVRVTVDNETPAAVADSAVTRPDQPITINVLSNDTDPEGDPLKVTRITEPHNGTVVKNNDGTLTYTPNPGFVGTDTFTYTVKDPDGNTNSATVTVVVDPYTPNAVDNAESTKPDKPITIAVVSDDSDPNGDTLTITHISQPGNGKVTDNGNGTLTYKPNPGFRGSDTFTYTVCDNSNHCDTAAVTVTVENAPPVAQDDSTSTRPNQPVSIPVLVNDSDPNGDPLIIQSIPTPPQNGTVTFTPDGTVIYTPKPGFTGIDTFVYEISDGHGGTDTATVTITVDDHSPSAVSESAVTKPKQPVTIDVLANDSDPDGDPLTISHITDPEHGSVMVNKDGTVTYTPDKGFLGTDTFTYTVKDPDGHTDTATVRVEVDPYIPDALDNVDKTETGKPVTIDILSDDSDPNGDALTLTHISQPANGTVRENTDGTLTYTPNRGFSGTDTFTYTVCDTTGRCDVATVTVFVENAPPVAEDDSVSTPPGKPVSIPVLVNDSDPNGDRIAIEDIVTQPENGTVMFTSDGTVIYTPNPGFTGTDTFVYEISDGKGGTDTAVVTVYVDNTTPTAVPDSIVIRPNTQVTLDVSANDTDPENEPLTVTGITMPGHGTVSINGDGTVTYTPEKDFVGTDTFVYTISDSDGNTGTATVTVVVDGDIPSAADDTESTLPGEPVTIDVLATDNDPNGDSLTISHISQPANGTVTENKDRTLTYTPNPGFSGTDTFTYTVCDTSGHCDIAAVTVIVKNLPPVAITDKARTPVNMPVQISVLDNDSDPNNDPLTVSDISMLPANGTVTINPDGTLTYTPKDGFVGTDIFEYLIDDGKGGTASAFVVIEVFDNRPVALPDRADTDSLSPLVIEVLANDSDPNNETLTVTAVTKPAHGKAEVNDDGTVTYTPNPGFSGSDVFTYTVCNESGNCDTETVTVTVENLPPNALNDSAATRPGTPVSVPVLVNDSDPDGQPLTITLISAMPKNGSVTIGEDGTVIYTPNPGFTGTDTFDYMIGDGHGGTDTATVTIRVDNESPTAVADHAEIRPGQAVTIPILANDSDPENDPLTVTNITKPAHGTITKNDNGQITYTPNSGFVGTDSFVYTICDDKRACDTATVSITVKNLPPQAEDDTVMTLPDVPVSIPVLANDSDPDGDPLIVTSVGTNITPTQGTVSIAADGQVIYSPNPGAFGTDIFDYMISDGFGGTATATVTVVIPNKGPVALPDTAMIAPGTPATIDVLQNDSGSEGNPLTITAVTKPANGTAVIDNGGTPDDLSDDRVIYTPNPGFSGTDTFDYSISDGFGGTAKATVTVTVIPPAETVVVSGRVFNDLNTDGIQNPGDPGLEGVRVVLTDSAGQSVESLTDKEGFYVFREVIPGSYTLTEINSEGFESSTPDMLEVGGYDSLLNFGDYLLPGVSGTVFDDADADGIQGENEGPLAGVRVYADLNGNGIWDENEPSDATGPDGDYHISALTPGSYVIRTDSSTIPSGYHSTGPESLSVTLVSGQNYSDADFGFRAVQSGTSGTIAGSVWNDANYDGIRSPDEGNMAGVTVNLIRADTVVATAVSDEKGYYRFDNLPPGDYIVEFVPPSEYVFTLRNQGENTARNSDVDETDGRTDILRISADSLNISADAGISQLKPDLGNTVLAVRDINGEDLEPGDILWYQVVIYNSGTGPASGVVYTDFPEPYTHIVSQGISTVTTTHGTVISGNREGDTEIGIDIGTIPPGESVVITYLLQVDADAPEGAVIKGQGQVSSNELPDEPTDNLNTVAINDPTVVGVIGDSDTSADVNISAKKTATDMNAGKPEPGDKVKYRVTITNDGPDTAKNLIFTDSAPLYTRLVAGSVKSDRGSVVEGPMFNVFIGDLAPGESVTIEFEVTIDADAPLNSLIAGQGVVTGDGNIIVFTDDPLTPEPKDSTLMRVSGTPYLEVYKTVFDSNGGSVNPGDILDYEVTVMNTDLGTIRGVVFYDQPQGHISLIPGTVSTGKGSVIREDTEVEVNIGMLGPEERVIIRFQVLLEKGTPEGTRVPNQGRAEFLISDSENKEIEYSDDPSTSRLDDPTTVIAVTDPYVVDPPSAYKKATGEGVNVIYWEMLWVNDKNTDAMLVHLEDVLPEGLIFIEDSLGADYGDWQYDPESRKVMWEGHIPGKGGQVHIWYHTEVPEGMNRVENQACGVWDRNGNGDWRDEAASVVSDIRVCTDDPKTSDNSDPTTWTRPCEFSVGNRVWNDSDADGYLSEGEKGIDGVRMNLYSDSDNSGDYTPDTDAFVASATTFTWDGTAGNYLLGNLCPGDYIVQIAPENFEPGMVLDGYVSSPGESDPDDGIDNDDNGKSMTGYGVVSKAISVRDSANTTADFGFCSCSLSLSAMIWNDINTDGIWQADAEKVIAGVRVNLWQDRDGSGDYTPGTDEPVSTVTQLAGDRYIFENLCPGDYLIQIAPENFDSGAVLNGYIPGRGLITPRLSLRTPGDIPVSSFDFRQKAAAMKPF